MKRVTLRVGKQNILESITVHIQKSQPVIASLVVDDGKSLGQGKVEVFPGRFFIGPGENGVLTWVSDDQFAAAIVVNIPEPHALVPALVGGEDRLTVQAQTEHHGSRFNPPGTVEMPGAPHVSV